MSLQGKNTPNINITLTNKLQYWKIHLSWLLLAKILTTALLPILNIWIFISFLFIFQQSNSIKYIQQQLKLSPDFIQRYLFVSSLLNLIEEISARKTQQYVNQNINSKNAEHPSNVRNFFSRLRKNSAFKDSWFNDFTIL